MLRRSISRGPARAVLHARNPAAGEHAFGRRRLGVRHLPDVGPKFLIEDVVLQRAAGQSARQVMRSSQARGNGVGFVFIGPGEDKGVGVETRPEIIDAFHHDRPQRDFALNARPGELLEDLFQERRKR